jgi:hypothetical protein
MVLEAISDDRPHQFSSCGPSDKWISEFLQRHLDRVSSRKGRILDTARVNAVTKHEMEYFFAEYSAFLSDYPLAPAQIYNCDETGIDPQGGTPKRVIAARGAKSVAVRRGADRENTTVLLAVNAVGSVISSLFIFKGATLPSDFLDGAPAGSCATTTPSAFIDSEVFEDWIDHFISHIPPTRTVLLILDNHTSHVGLPVRRKCVANGIHILSFPPIQHTSFNHSMQVAFARSNLSGGTR